MEEKPPVRQERADARRNREKILRAAQRVLAERGAIAPLDEIARRAGVGAGTLYRRFPDRSSLLRALALDVVQVVTDEVEAAWAEEGDAFAMVSRYMHKALSVRIGAVMSALRNEVALQEELEPARDALVARVGAIVHRAHAEGSLRRDVTVGDLGMLIVRLCRPMPGPFPDRLDDELAQRHLEIVLAGLRTVPAPWPAPLRGPALDVAALRRVAQRAQHSGVAVPATGVTRASTASREGR